MNYYPFHIGDYLSATRHLSWEEDAAYRRCLDTYYTTEKPLPADLRQVCRLVLATTETQREAVETVLGEFFQLTEFGWVNSRADLEIVAMKEKQQKQRDRVNKRWDKIRTAHGTTGDNTEYAPGITVESENDTTVSNNDTNVIPPTPTPTPITIHTAKAVARVSRKKAHVSLPDDFMPNDAGTNAATEKGIDAKTELEKFKNYHLAKASTMADWQAAWRTWVGNARVSETPKNFGVKRGSDEYAKLHKTASWWADAGFDNVWSAMDAGCYHDTANRFADGKKLQVVAA